MKRYIYVAFFISYYRQFSVCTNNEEFLQKYFEHTGLQKLDFSESFRD
jgi:hypothetical protein